MENVTHKKTYHFDLSRYDKNKQDAYLNEIGFIQNNNNTIIFSNPIMDVGKKTNNIHKNSSLNRIVINFDENNSKRVKFLRKEMSLVSLNTFRFLFCKLQKNF